jgi:hypothetical protein
MARPKIRVQHFLACRGVEVEGSVEPDNPYTLRTVKYGYSVPADTEFPGELEEVWVFCRLLNLNGGTGRVEFVVEVVWIDGPNGEELTCYFPGLTAFFPPGETVLSRAWRFARIRVPGQGRYEFRLRAGRRDRLVAQEFIQIERVL